MASRNKASAASASSGSRSRFGDFEDDVFDVAHNTLLRSSAEQQSAVRKAKSNLPVTLDWEDDDGPKVKAITMKSHHGAASASKSIMPSTALVVTPEDATDEDHLTAASIRAAVDKTWAKANALQDQAVAAAVKAAIKDLEENAKKDKEKALAELEAKLHEDAEQATRRLWEIAHREQAAAIAKALEEQAAEVARLKEELAQQEKKAADALEKAYLSMKEEARRAVEEQNTQTLNATVQATWDAAARMEQTAVAAARKEARAEAEREFDERIKLERMHLNTETRQTLQSGAQAQADELSRNREEMHRLRQELERERAAARDAEAKAAKQQQAAVKEAMAAVEKVAKANEERAVARALAAQAKLHTSHDSDLVAAVD